MEICIYSVIYSSINLLPEEDKVYVYYNYSVNSNTNRVTMSDKFFAFKLRVIE